MTKMTLEEYSGKVWTWFPCPIAYPDAKDFINADIKYRFERGWLWTETARLINCSEEIQGDKLPEEIALARMARIHKEVAARIDFGPVQK
jgi:hypothetical protein